MVLTPLLQLAAASILALTWGAEDRPAVAVAPTSPAVVGIGPIARPCEPLRSGWGEPGTSHALPEPFLRRGECGPDDSDAGKPARAPQAGPDKPRQAKPADQGVCRAAPRTAYNGRPLQVLFCTRQT